MSCPFESYIIFSLFDCIKGMILCKRFARMQGNFPIGFNPMYQINVIEKREKYVFGPSSSHKV